jgi:hypothetical protein
MGTLQSAEEYRQKNRKFTVLYHPFTMIVFGQMSCGKICLELVAAPYHNN